MEVKFTVTKEERKALVKAVSEVTGLESVYHGAPSFAFAVGDYTIDRYGTLVYGDGIGAEEVRLLLMGLTERGFVFEGDIDKIALATSEWDEAVSDKLTIHMPLSGFTASGLDNLGKLIAAKAWILRKMAATDTLPIERDEKYLRFPWFKMDASAVEIDAYSRLIAGLCETAKTKQRVTATERQLQDGDNEKFKARCFLLAIGFIGKEYSQARKILLVPFSGSGSHRSGNRKRAADTQEAAATVSSGVAIVPTWCSKCPHHCYYSDGLMLNADGDAVDTSKKAPIKYTHYCLAAPSGFRKLKHAIDWSGGETPPRWCPLKGAVTADSGEENPKASVAHEDDSCTDSADTGGEGGGYSGCLACANSLNELAENGGNQLFCVVKQDYVEANGSCSEFNSLGGAAL